MKQTKKLLTVVVLLMSALFIFGCQDRNYQTQDVYLTLDINPSIEIIVNENGKVLHVNPLNEDAELLLLDLNLRGLDIEDVIDIIIEEAIKLGFIDINREENIILVDAQAIAAEIRERIRERVKAEINEAFRKRAMMGRAEDNPYLPAHVQEAEAYGVNPGFLRMAKAVAELDDEMTLEEALEMTLEELIGILKVIREENKDVAHQIREAFLEQSEALRAEYLDLINDLLEQIENEEGNREALMQQVQALRAELLQKLEALRLEFLAQSEVLRMQMMNQRQAIAEANQARVNEFLEQAEARREEMRERIEEFQKGRDNRP
jgi:hypothetical protein